MSDYIISNNKISIESDFITLKLHNYYLYYKPRLNFKILNFKNHSIIIDGVLVYENENKLIEKLLENTLNESYLDELFNGQFNIYVINGETMFVITDLLNVNRAFFNVSSDGVFVSNNLNNFIQLLPHKNIESIDVNGFFQLLSRNYCNIHNHTPLKNVYSFPNASLLKLNKVNHRFETIKNDKLNKVANVKKFSVKDIQKELKQNTDVFLNLCKKFIVPFSGGIDSRIVLFSLIEKLNKIDLVLMTHGEFDDIEYRISHKIAKFFNLKHILLSIKELYPNKIVLNSYLKNGLNLLIAKWVPLKKQLDDIDKDSLILFGDLFDLLRAKNIRSIRSKKQRILIQLGLYKFKNETFSINDAKNFIIRNHLKNIREALINYKLIFKRFDITQQEFEDNEITILKDLFNHIETVFEPESGYEFEELFYIHTWSKGSMCNQSRWLNQFFISYTILANRKFVKYCLSIPIKNRFEDKLVHKILKNNKLSYFPTSQIPIIPYNFPIFLKYFVWGFRSFTDQFYMKIANRLEFKKNRLFKTENWKLIYNHTENRINFHSYFEGFEKEFDFVIKYYDNRASGKSRPLSDMDLSSSIIPAYIWKNFVK